MIFLLGNCFCIYVESVHHIINIGTKYQFNNEILQHMSNVPK